MTKTPHETVTIGKREYEVIQFNSKITNKSVTLQGIALAQGYLAVAPGYRIYNTRSGDPILRGRFLDFNAALKFAWEYLEAVYAEFFPLWEVYPDANLISWCKYSVENGAVIFEMIEYLNTLDTISNKDVARADYIGREKAKEWNRPLKD